MEYFSYLSPDEIPTQCFSYKKVRDSEMSGAINALSKHSMVKKGVDVLSIHRLVQAVIRIEREEKQRYRLSCQRP